MKMVSSYVMQDDQLFPMLTVFETFMFAAEVRLPPSISRDEKRKRVYELLEQLGLQVNLKSLSHACAHMNLTAQIIHLDSDEVIYAECNAYLHRR